VLVQQLASSFSYITTHPVEHDKENTNKQTNKKKKKKKRRDSGTTPGGNETVLLRSTVIYSPPPSEKKNEITVSVALHLALFQTNNTQDNTCYYKRAEKNIHLRKMVVGWNNLKK
jgi:hypothetical protein